MSPLARPRATADWWIDRLYDFAADLGATVVRTAISRTVIDVNRDPSGASLYPGPDDDRAVPDRRPSTASRSTATARSRTPAEIDARRASYLRRPIMPRSRPRSTGCGPCTGRSSSTTAIRSARCIPRLFEGELPEFNIGTNGGASARPGAAGDRSARSCAETGDEPCRQRPLQGRLDHAALRPAGDRRPRAADGARRPRLPARAATARATPTLGRRRTMPSSRRRSAPR